MADTICSFLTRKDGKPRTFGIVADRRGRPLSLSGLRELALMANRNPGACAYGKVVVLGNDGIYSFQAMPNGDTLPTFCGNSTAAALSCFRPFGAVRATVHGASDIPYEISARIRGDSVTQNWFVPAGSVTERRWRGRRVINMATLNDYAVIEGGLPPGMSADIAAGELLKSRAGKLAVIGGPAQRPVVEFYNANGRHGAIPQTGVATLAIAARSVPWLSECFEAGQISYLVEARPVTAQLPALRDLPCGRISIEMPATNVSLSPLAMELVA